MAFEGIENRTAAELWRDRTFLVPESEVDPPDDDEIFIHDLVGMRVVLAAGETLGEVSEVFELPQGLVFEVARPAGKPVLLPFNDQTVVGVDSAERVITVDPLEGLVE